MLSRFVISTLNPMAGPQPDTPVPATPAEKDGTLGTILLAEDHPTNIFFLTDYLEGHGYAVVVANNGLEALKTVETIKPSIILMDIQMPVMDGFEAIRRIRANPSLATIPIIALTAMAMAGDRERCIEAGANDYIGKPISLKHLLQMIKELLNSR